MSKCLRECVVFICGDRDGKSVDADRQGREGDDGVEELHVGVGEVVKSIKAD